jgi:hypothetical protein
VKARDLPPFWPRAEANVNGVVLGLNATFEVSRTRHVGDICDAAASAGRNLRLGAHLSGIG